MPQHTDTDQLVAAFKARGGQITRMAPAARPATATTIDVAEITAHISRSGRAYRRLAVAPTAAAPDGQVHAFDPAIIAEIDAIRAAGLVPGRLDCATRRGRKGHAILARIHRATAP